MYNTIMIYLFCKSFGCVCAPKQGSATTMHHSPHTNTTTQQQQQQQQQLEWDEGRRGLGLETQMRLKPQVRFYLFFVHFFF